MGKAFIHSHALVETNNIGDDTRIWAFAHIMKDAIIGTNCNIGDGVFIESGVKVGNNVTIKNGVMLWEGVEIFDNAFIGPNVIFTNDLFPRSPRLLEVKEKYFNKDWLVKTYVEEGVSIGANSTIKAGINLGEYCSIGAGSVVTKDILPYRLAYGNPATVKGFVNTKGEVLVDKGDFFESKLTNDKYILLNNKIITK